MSKIYNSKLHRVRPTFLSYYLIVEKQKWFFSLGRHLNTCKELKNCSMQNSFGWNELKIIRTSQWSIYNHYYVSKQVYICTNYKCNEENHLNRSCLEIKFTRLRSPKINFSRPTRIKSRLLIFFCCHQLVFDFIRNSRLCWFNTRWTKFLMGRELKDGVISLRAFYTFAVGAKTILLQSSVYNVLNVGQTW